MCGGEIFFEVLEEGVHGWGLMIDQFIQYSILQMARDQGHTRSRH